MMDNRYEEALEKAMELYLKSKDTAARNVLEEVFPELKESSDEEIRKGLIDFFKIGAENGEQTNGIYDKDILAWLEKQGKQKKLVPKFKIGDTMRTLQEAADGYTDGMPVVISVDKEYYHCTNELIAIKDQDNYEFPPMNKIQTHTDKVEPKFKVGDWIVFNGLSLFIKEVVLGYYRTISVDGIPNSYDWNIDNAARLWTISDAREGDVLFEDKISSLPSPFIVIFKKKGSGYTFSSHCFIGFDGKFYEGEDGHYSENVHPATKEQRDLLFQKMKEAGYEWNTDKKELKKIEDEPNKCEGCNNVKGCIACVDGSEWAHIEEQKPADNIEPTSTWDEEDEKRIERLLGWIDTLINYIHHDVTVSLDLRRERMQQVEQLKTWLKSLQLQNTWKSSNEHIHWLKWVINRLPDTEKTNEAEAVLEDLLEQLKKFGEE